MTIPIHITPEDEPTLNPLELALLRFVVGNIIDHVEQEAAERERAEQGDDRRVA